MLIIAAVFLVAGLLALRVKFPAEIPNTSPLYRVDNRVVAAVSFFVSLCFFVLGITGWFSAR